MRTGAIWAAGVRIMVVAGSTAKGGEPLCLSLRASSSSDWVALRSSGAAAGAAPDSVALSPMPSTALNRQRTHAWLADEVKMEFAMQ